MDEAAPQGGNFVQIYRPPLVDRIFARLGFGRAHVPRPPDEEIEGFAPGYMLTDTVVVFDWRDRLRALISGAVHVQSLHQIDVMPKRFITASAVRVLSPNIRLHPRVR